MRSDLGPVRILSPRAQHAVAAELRLHELAVEVIAVPIFATEPPPLQTIGTLPAFLLVRREPRSAQRARRRRN